MARPHGTVIQRGHALDHLQCTGLPALYAGLAGEASGKIPAILAGQKVNEGHLIARSRAGKRIDREEDGGAEGKSATMRNSRMVNPSSRDWQKAVWKRI